MILTTTETVPGRDIAEVLGIARGNAVRARFAGMDFIAGIRNFVGGEVDEYSQLMAQAREQAMDRMIGHAERLGANAIVCVRFGSSSIAQQSSEVFAYGTAVRLR